MRLSGTRTSSIHQYRGLGDQLWDLGGARPTLDLNFAHNKSLVDSTTGQNLVTFTRASSGTYVDSAGVIQTATNDVPRFDHNPTTGESLGLLVEEARTNLLLYSATLSTQNVTVTATAYTLSFTGTGTVTLSGTSTAGPLVGTGTGEGNRVSLTFTPTAGTLTLTVSGTVSNAQLEAGSFRTSYIPTTSATVTRAADVATITGSNFSSWYNQTEGTMFSDAIFSNTTSYSTIFNITSGTSAERFRTLQWNDGTSRIMVYTTGGVAVASLNSTGVVGRSKNIGAYKVNDFAGVANGGSVLTDTAGALSTLFTFMEIGCTASTFVLNGPIRRLTYWPTRLSDTNLQRVTQ